MSAPGACVAKEDVGEGTGVGGNQYTGVGGEGATRGGGEQWGRSGI